MSAPLLVILLGLLLGLQPLTTDLYLPALPRLTADLDASLPQAQLTLTALLLAFGLSQLVLGPLSDRYGRRPVLIGGLALYTLAAAGCVLAPDVEWLIGLRALQGVGMGAAVMGARAIVRDVYPPDEGARAMARALGILGLIACASPLLGGLLAHGLGWRAALAALALCGAALLALLLLRYAETAPAPQPLQPARLLHNWLFIARQPAFIAWAGLLAVCYAGLFTFLAASSFVFQQVYAMSPLGYGLALSWSGAAFVLGTLLCRRLLPRLGLQRTAAVAGALSLAGGGGIALVGWTGLHHGLAFLVPHTLFMVAHGIHQPCAQTAAVARFPQFAGAASALSGFILTAVAFGVGAWLGRRLDGTALALTEGMGFWSVVIAGFAWGAVRRWGDVSTPAEPPSEAVAGSVNCRRP